MTNLGLDSFVLKLYVLYIHSDRILVVKKYDFISSLFTREILPWILFLYFEGQIVLDSEEEQNGMLERGFMSVRVKNWI